MANVKITDLFAASPLTGAELAELVQSTLSVKATVTDIANTFDRTVDPSQGGTGLTGYLAGDMLYAASPTELTTIAAGGANKVLLSTATATFTATISSTTMTVAASPAPVGVIIPGMVLSGGTVDPSTAVVEQLSGTQGGAGTYTVSIGQSVSSVVMTGVNATAPSWGAVDLSSMVEGVTGVVNGGTGLSSYAAGNLIYATGSTALGVVPPSPVTGTALVWRPSAVFTGTIATTVLSVSVVASGVLVPGMVLTGGAVATGTTIIEQLPGGTPGGAGTYTVSISQTLGLTSLTGTTAANVPAWGAVSVAGGGTGASTLTGYVKGNGTSAMTASATVPWEDITNSPHNYGAFYDTTTQTAGANTATVVLVNSTSLVDGVTLSGGSLINIPVTGIYNIAFSLQLANSGAADYQISIWLRKNGATDLANSCTDITVPAKTGAVNGYAVAAWNVMESFTAGQYFQLVWSTPNASAFIEAIGVRTTPTRPATPSVILTVQQVA